MANPLMHNMSPLAKVLIFLGLTFFLGAIGSIITGGIAMVMLEIPADQAMGIITGRVDHPQAGGFIRGIALGNQAFGFLLASWLFIKVFGRESFAPSYWRNSIWLLAVPLVYILLNPILEGSIVLNEWLIPEGSWIENIFKPLEESAKVTMDKILLTDSPAILLLNLFVVALLPAIGEEWAFRGIVQGQFAKFFKNEHVAIWTTGIVFSAYHMQFYGFIPRMLMGVALGYLLIWTRSMWVPILLHFINNAGAVILTYLDNRGTIDMEAMSEQTMGWSMAIPLTVLLIGLGWYMYRRSDWGSHRQEYFAFRLKEY